jgi:enoyl-CoA hydratase
MSVELDRRDDAWVMQLNRPEALNALSADVIGQIDDAIDAVEASDARVLVVTGAGDKAFCAGADIKELRDQTALGHRNTLERGQRAFARINALPMPSLAYINGFAMGGGLELALGCTFRLAAPTAKMGLPEIRLGLLPGFGGTQRLPRLIGEGRALDLVMTGRAVDAVEAERIGLVHGIVDSLEAALEYAGRFTGYGLPALALAREAVQRASSLPMTEGLKVEAQLGALGFSTADAQEGMAAFEEKRKPAFRDC